MSLADIIAPLALGVALAAWAFNFRLIRDAAKQRELMRKLDIWKAADDDTLKKFIKIVAKYAAQTDRRLKDIERKVFDTTKD